MAGLRFDIQIRGIDRLGLRMAHASEEAKHAIAIQAARDTEPFVPALTKSLANRTRVEGDTIIYPGPYARFLYHGKVMIDPNTGSTFAPYGATKVVTGRDLEYNKTVHSKAQDHWFEASKAQNIQKWIRVSGRTIQHEF